MTVVDLIAGIVHKHPERPALSIGQRTWSYRELWASAKWVANEIVSTKLASADPVAVFAARSFPTYASILGILDAGHKSLPINAKYPLDRVRKLLQISGCTVALCDKGFVSQLGEELDALFHELGIRRIDVSGVDKIMELQSETPRTAEHHEYADRIEPVDAYLLFTSGTTGDPKGIVISHQNLLKYVNFVAKKYPLTPDDRCSQAFDTTFDPSAHDMFVTWTSGACLCVLGGNDLLLPNEFIKRNKLTVWYSVPSIALRMKQRGMLKSGSLPLLRYSIFSGEALPDHIASAWQLAAPNSRLINYYGPTEVTINITDYEWNAGLSSKNARNGIVPIGKVFNTHDYRVVDETLNQVPTGEVGELIITGPQVSKGYLNNPEKTKENFITIQGKDEIWYRTGDLVAELPDNTIQYIGRSDHQMKIRGYRVELGEIEEVLRQVKGVTEAVVLPVISQTGVADAVVAFVLAEERAQIERTAINTCRKVLPEYMVPAKVVVITAFPLSPTGKIDRNELQRRLVKL